MHVTSGHSDVIRSSKERGHNGKFTDCGFESTINSFWLSHYIYSISSRMVAYLEYVVVFADDYSHLDAL